MTHLINNDSIGVSIDSKAAIETLALIVSTIHLSDENYSKTPEELDAIAKELSGRASKTLSNARATEALMHIYA